jgi:hypothetical protein
MAKQELLATIRDRYRASSKREKSRILDEFIAVTGHHRKHGIRLLGQSGNDREQQPAVKKGRRIYDDIEGTRDVPSGIVSGGPPGGDAGRHVDVDPGGRTALSSPLYSHTMPSPSASFIYWYAGCPRRTGAMPWARASSQVIRPLPLSSHRARASTPGSGVGVAGRV